MSIALITVWQVTTITEAVDWLTIS